MSEADGHCLFWQGLKLLASVVNCKPGKRPSLTTRLRFSFLSKQHNPKTIGNHYLFIKNERSAATMVHHQRSKQQRETGRRQLALLANGLFPATSLKTSTRRTLRRTAERTAKSDSPANSRGSKQLVEPPEPTEPNEPVDSRWSLLITGNKC